MVVFLASNYMAVCRCFSVIRQKSSYCAPEFRVVTSVSECLYKIDPLFALLTSNKLVYLKV